MVDNPQCYPNFPETRRDIQALLGTCTGPLAQILTDLQVFATDVAKATTILP